MKDSTVNQKPTNHIKSHDAPKTHTRAPNHHKSKDPLHTSHHTKDTTRYGLTDRQRLRRIRTWSLAKAASTVVRGERSPKTTKARTPIPWDSDSGVSSSTVALSRVRPHSLVSHVASCWVISCPFAILSQVRRQQPSLLCHLSCHVPSHNFLSCIYFCHDTTCRGHVMFMLVLVLVFVSVFMSAQLIYKCMLMFTDSFTCVFMFVFALLFLCACAFFPM